MSFLVRNSDTKVNIKLTDIGRRRLAQGQLTFDKAVVSDREVDYGFNRKYPFQWQLNPNAGTEYVLSGNTLLSPKDDHPFLPSVSYDGAAVFSLSANVHVNRVVTTAQTEATGIWSAITSGDKYTIGSYRLQGYRVSGVNSTQLIDGDIEPLFSTSNVLNGTMPLLGELMYMRSSVPPDNGFNVSGSTAEPNPHELNNYPFVSLWHRIQAELSINQRRLDRVPRYLPASLGTDITTSAFYVYKHDAIDTYFGSAATVSSSAWNLNITRTSREIGWDRKALGGNTGYTYANYEAAGYNGTKQYFGFEDDIRQVGFIHYSNENTGQTYWERLEPGATELDFPDLLWHRTRNSNDEFYMSGVSMNCGHRFTDFGSDTYYDETAQANYTLLKDRPTGNTLTVGRVYFDLKTIVLTDPELLTAMSYKSNRNWTLPRPLIKSVPNPRAPFNINTKPGFMKSNFNYYVTYLTYTGQETNQYGAGRNFSLQQPLPCQYIQKVSGYTDDNGYNQHLYLKMPHGGFPYMRTHPEFETLSGTGWGCTAVQVLVQEIHKDKDTGVDALHPARWSGCSELRDGFAAHLPGGVYSVSESQGQRGIEATGLTNAEFIVSQLDITTGTTLSAFQSGSTSNLYKAPSGLTTFLDYKNNGLTLGSEHFLNGAIKAVKQKELYQSFFTMVVNGDELNTTSNASYVSSANTETYITEIGVLNQENELVAVGKPNYPITKADMQFLVLQLKLEF